MVKTVASSINVIDIHPYEGRIMKGGQLVAEFRLRSEVLFDEVRAGWRINLIIGRSLTARAREFLGLPTSTVFRLPQPPAATQAGFTLAQKMVGRACGLPEGQGIRPGTYFAPATPADIAPTLAFLAGTGMSRADGRVLHEALLPAGPFRQQPAATAAR